MNFELDHDLTAWADGTLSREDLITLHGREARGLVALHERLLRAAEMPAPDPGAGWALLQQKMGARVVPIGDRPRSRLRRAVFAVAAALLIGGGAFAAIRGVAVDHPSVLSPPAGTPSTNQGVTERAPGQNGQPADATGGRSSGPGTSSSPGPTSGGSGGGSTGGGTDGTSGTDGTGGSGDSGGTTGGTGGTQDPAGDHPGQGNGGEDNGKDGPHGHGGTSTSTHA